MTGSPLELPTLHGQRLLLSLISRDPYQAIIGDVESADGSVSVNAPGIGENENLSLADFVERMQAEIHDRRIEPSVVSPVSSPVSVV